MTPPPTEVTERPPLLPHQQATTTWINQVQRGLLGDEPGLGKSRSAIESFQGAERVLVIAPAMVIHGGTWSDEIERWADNPGAYTVAPYSMLNARQGPRPVNRLRDEYQGHWDAIVVDEAHYIKGRKTTWTWATQQAAKRADQVMLMTGTPMPNWAHELFTMLRVLRPDEAKPGGPLGSHQRWIRTWFDTFNPTENLRPDLRNPHAEAVAGLKACYPECADRPADDPCEHWGRFVDQNLGARFLRRRRDDVLADLPPSTTSEVRVPLDTAARKMYRELKNDLLTMVDDQEIVAWSSGSRNVMLDKITTSPWLITKEGEPRGGKFEALRFDLEGRSRPTLVLAHYRDTVDACVWVAQSTGARAAAVHGGIPKAQAGQAIRDFKDGKLDVLVGSLETIAEGLTLTVADMAIFVERSYKPSRNDQAEKRIHRMGQTRPVTIRDYIAPKSVDENKRILLATKTDQQMRVLSAREFAGLV